MNNPPQPPSSELKACPLERIAYLTDKLFHAHIKDTDSEHRELNQLLAEFKKGNLERLIATRTPPPELREAVDLLENMAPCDDDLKYFNPALTILKKLIEGGE